jgi:hypothetical protein
MDRFNIKDMEKFAEHGWGEFGLAVARKWLEFNRLYFAGKLQPIPIILTPTMPFGKRIADCWSDKDQHGRGLIRLSFPRTPGAHGGYRLLADNNTLLHEMVHQCLFERGECPKHKSEGWRREIMRLNKAITGREIWAGKPTTKRMPGPDGKLTKIVRTNKAHEDGRPSLTQKQIARWPHDGCGIDLGHLGSKCSRSASSIQTESRPYRAVFVFVDAPSPLTGFRRHDRGDVKRTVANTYATVGRVSSLFA